LLSEESRQFTIARDVVVDEINMLKSRVLHGNDSKVQSNIVEQNKESLSRGNEELVFPLMENNISVDSELSEQLNENSTYLENADPVVEAGDKLK